MASPPSCFAVAPALSPRTVPSLPPRRLPRRAQVLPRAAASGIPPSPRDARVLRTPSWANTTGARLRRVAEDLFVAERSYIWLGTFDVGARMTVVRRGGALLVYSPLPLDAAARARLDALGEVRVVLAPNREHVDFAAAWAAAYPRAAVLWPRGAGGGRREAVAVGEGVVWDEALCGWEGLVPVYVAGAPFFEEVVLVDRRAGALVCCDLFWNYPDEAPVATRVWKAAMGRVYRPAYNRVLVRDRVAWRRAYEELRAEGVRAIVPCHGDVVEEDGERVLQEFFPEFLVGE